MAGAISRKVILSLYFRLADDSEIEDDKPVLELFHLSERHLQCTRRNHMARWLLIFNEQCQTSWCSPEGAISVLNRQRWDSILFLRLIRRL
jgi:hypothetical protein